MKKTHIMFILIILLGLGLRLLNLDKSGGLWYDEATIYSIASQNGINGMLNYDSHRFLMFPLYYLIYKLWLIFFGNSDLTIRLMSVFFDICALITAYFLGKQLALNINKNETKIGLISALLYSINSSFIYYAQEAKFYSLTFFIINLLILFWLKYIKNTSAKNLLWVLILNYILFFTYTSQVLLILLLGISTVIYFIRRKHNNEALKYFFGISPILLLCVIFKKYFSGNFDAVIYDNSFIILAAQNWFTPVLQGLQNNILNYHLVLLKNIFNPQAWIFIIFPASLIIYGITKGLKEKLVIPLFMVAISYVSFHIIFTILTDYTVLVRYTLPVLPLFLLVAATGLYNTKKWILVLFTIVNLLGIISAQGAINIQRPDGYRILGEILTKYVSPSSDFILPIRTDLLDKYYKITGKRYSLYSLNSNEAMKTYLSEIEIRNLQNGKTQNISKNHQIKRWLASDEITNDFNKFVLEQYPTKRTLVVLSDKTISMYSNPQLKQITQLENFDNFPFQFLRLSKLNNDLIIVFLNNMKLKNKIINKNWEIHIFEL